MADFAQIIRRYFQSDDARPQRPTALAELLRIKKSQWSPFKAVVEQLVASGELYRSANGTVSRPRQESLLTGKIRRGTRGQGYFTSDEPPAEGEEATIFVGPEDLHGALTGDRVRLQLSKRRRSGGQRIGKVTEILDRARSTYVGEYFEYHQRGYVRVDGGVFDDPVSVGDPGAKGVRPGDKVVLEMVRYPGPRQTAEAVVVQVLGPRGQPGVDCLGIIHEFALPDEFPEAVHAAARQQADHFDETNFGDRLDLTNETIVTIDPADARDFDDAISLTQDDRGHWRLGVHIADVSHFVTPGSVLDKEAQKRGTSVYLPDRVLPMLPEVISNGLASLQEGEVRYTKSAFIDFTPDGIPTHADFANSVIKATQRFAYEEAAEILGIRPVGSKQSAVEEEKDDDHAVLPEGQMTNDQEPQTTPEVLALLRRMHKLAMILRKRRFANGALDLQLPEVKVDFDANGKVNGAHKVLHDESHQIIEEFMLAANIAVATRLSELEIPYLHRSHASPDERKLKALGDFVKGLGFDVQPWVGRQEIQNLLTKVRGQPVEQAISYATLRSLKQAEYSPAAIGHYALNEVHYCHFTSPIRRYPDLAIHRLVDELVRHPKKPRYIAEAELVKLGEHCSQTERKAEAAERELVKIKLLTYLAGRIGWKQTATITGVERYGLFCLGEELPAEGMIPLKRLPGDIYEYEDRTHTLTARRSGTVYRLGDRIEVEVAAVDLEKRLMEWALVATKKPVAHKIAHKTVRKAAKKRRR